MNWWNPPIPWHCESIYECKVMNRILFFFNGDGLGLKYLAYRETQLARVTQSIGLGGRISPLTWQRQCLRSGLSQGQGCRAHLPKHADSGTPSTMHWDARVGRPSQAQGHCTTAALVHLHQLSELLRFENNGKLLMRKYISNLKAIMEIAFHLHSIWVPRWL